MGNRAFQVQRILKDEYTAVSSFGGVQVSVVVYDAQDSDDARIKGAEMLGVSPTQVTVEEFETTGLSMEQGIAQAQALDSSPALGAQMAEWLRNG